MHELRPDLIILDEAQRIRNWATATARTIKQLKSRYAFVLTGTPLENKLEELFSVVEFVDGRRLGPAFRFLHEHRVEGENGHLLGYRGLDRIHDQLAPVLLRRTRAEVLKELPERTDQVFRVPLTLKRAEPSRAISLPRSCASGRNRAGCPRSIRSASSAAFKTCACHDRSLEPAEHSDEQPQPASSGSIK